MSEKKRFEKSIYHSLKKGLIFLTLLVFIQCSIQPESISNEKLNGAWYFFDSDLSYNELHISSDSILFFHSDIMGTQVKIFSIVDSERIEITSPNDDNSKSFLFIKSISEDSIVMEHDYRVISLKRININTNVNAIINDQDKYLEFSTEYSERKISFEHTL
jgi:hypothetical protein